MAIGPSEREDYRRIRMPSVASDTKSELLSRIKDAALYSLNEPQDIVDVAEPQPQPIGLMTLNPADLKPLQTQGTAYGTAAESLRRQRVGMASKAPTEKDILGVVTKVAQLDKKSATDLYNRTLGPKYGMAKYSEKERTWEIGGKLYRMNEAGDAVEEMPGVESKGAVLAKAMADQGFASLVRANKKYNDMTAQEKVYAVDKLGGDALLAQRIFGTPGFWEQLMGEENNRPSSEKPKAKPEVKADQKSQSEKYRALVEEALGG